jgi:eukaryotic-like serine/threonine-protein kinase
MDMSQQILDDSKLAPVGKAHLHGNAPDRARTVFVPAAGSLGPQAQGILADGSGTGPPRMGRVFANEYLMLGPLGEGATGTVWHARHLRLHRERAIKIIAPTLACSPRDLARAGEEAMAMTRLGNPHVAEIHGFGFADGHAYIEMDLVPGRSLDRLLESGRPLPPVAAIRIVAQLCEVLQDAHDHRINHHALKPANLMLLDGRLPGHEQLMVLDFGVSKLLDDDIHTLARMCLTRRAEAVGAAPGYLSPEQILGQASDHRVDIYATGAILYELVTGHCPFDGNPWTFVPRCIRDSPPPFPARRGGRSVPPELERIALWCLAKNPNDRPASARDIAAALMSIDLHNQRGSKEEVSCLRTCTERQTGDGMDSIGPPSRQTTRTSLTTM